MKIVLIGITILLLFGALLYAATGSRMAVDKGAAYEKCLNEVKAAQESSLEKICTQEARLLSCALDPSFTYEASNGCEISFLVEEGWR
ncbi:MAG: hypothetical protein HYY60_01615 [Parcubacteria group bacterium]|nr:hypothetical protein [Parcubacteria group bacterium]MBI3075083.1 hypothetical protein [Parcubacteria group bacterium]